MGKLRFRKPKTDEYLGIPPVGIILAFSKEVSPAEIYGGTWERCGQGKTLVGVNESDNDFIAPTTVIAENGNLSVTEKTGGEKTHTLSVSELATHDHQLLRYPDAKYQAGFGGGTHTGILSETAANVFIENIMTDTRGSNQPHNNLQPYMTAYFWRRIA